MFEQASATGQTQGFATRGKIGGKHNMALQWRMSVKARHGGRQCIRKELLQQGELHGVAQRKQYCPAGQAAMGFVILMSSDGQARQL